MPRRKNIKESDEDDDEDDESYNDDSDETPKKNGNSNEDDSESSSDAKSNSKKRAKGRFRGRQKQSSRKDNGREAIRSGSKRTSRQKFVRVDGDNSSGDSSEASETGKRPTHGQRSHLRIGNSNVNTRPRINVSMLEKSRKKKTVDKNDDSYISSENEQSEDELEDDDDFEPSNSSNHDSSDNSDENNFSSDESLPKRRSKRQKKAPIKKVTRSRTKQTGRLRSVSQNDIANESFDDNDSSVEIVVTGSKRKISHFKRQTTAEKKELIKDTSEDESTGEFISRASSRNSKQCTTSGSGRPNRRCSPRRSSGPVSYDEGRAIEEDEEWRPQRQQKTRSKPRFNRKESSDEDEEEFLPKDVGDSGESDDNLVFAPDELTDDVVLRKVGSRQGKSGNEIGYIDEDKLGDADADIDDSNSTVNRKPVGRVKRQHSPSSSVTPFCSSTEDVITCDTLPKKHVCFFPPDQGTPQCFCLSTLRKIALSSAHPKFRTDLTGGQQTFLQPPHFRAPMSDDLLDQIASRFGREALDLNGPFYNRKEDTIGKDEGWYDQDDTGDDETNLMDQVQHYVRSIMGSRDIYTCPVCYIVAHQHLKDFMSNEKITNKKDSEPIEGKYTTDFTYDPMAVLGYEDNDAFEVSSAFCFNKAAEVKHHLRNEHKIDTRRVKGNALYERFKIRAPDGLLQQYLNRLGDRRHGKIMQYWFEGNNISFVHLFSQIHHAGYCREIVSDSQQSDEESDEESEGKINFKAKLYLQPANTFFRSFANEVHGIWEMISSPFQQETEEEIRAFIANDDDDIGNEAAMYQAFNLDSVLDEQAENEQAVAYYESKVKDDPEEYGEIDNSELIFEDDDSDDDEDLNSGSLEYNPDSSDDHRPRPTSSQRKRRAIQKANGTPTPNTRRLSTSKHTRNASDSPLGFDEEKKENTEGNFGSGASIRKRLVLDDDDVLINNSATHPITDPSQSQETPVDAARKRLVINESEDDD